MVITAKYSSVCPVCGKDVKAGTKVEWTKGSKATHVACSGGTTVARPKKALRNGDIYTSRRTGMEAVFGCAACSRLGRMCRDCRFDEYDF